MAPRRLLCLASFIAIALVPVRATAQRPSEVPFVGCAADGQVGPVAPPHGTAPPAPKAIANEVAYYKGTYTGGIFGPRGWHCREAYGSNGSVLLIAPEPLPSGVQFPSLHSAAIQVVVRDGGTSGRFDVAHDAALFFPRIAAAYIQRVRAEQMVPDSDLAPKRYPRDSVWFLAWNAAAFVTPPRTRGFGTESYLAPNSSPIRGLVVLDTTDDWGVHVLQMRLAGASPFADSLLALDNACMRAIRRC